MCSSGAGIITGEAAHGKAAFKADCGSWDCEIAGPRQARRLQRKIEAARPNRFFTFTIRHHPERTLEQDVEMLKACIRKFLIWWPKQPRGSKIEICQTWEVTGERHVHVHAAARCAYVPVAVLISFFDQEIKSPRQDVRLIRHQKELSRYLTKYITKGLAKLQGTHRYSASHGFFDKDAIIPRDPFFNEGSAIFQNETLPNWAHHWLCRGFVVNLDMKHGRCTARPP